MVNLAQALRYLADESTEAAPACEAAEALRAVVDRGEPSDALADVHGDLAVLQPLCEARRLRDGALTDDSPEPACYAIEAYRVASSVNTRDGAKPRIPLELTAEMAPLAGLCARRGSASNAMDPARTSAPIALRWHVGARLGGGAALALDAPPSGIEATAGPVVGAALVGEWQRLSPWMLRASAGYAMTQLHFNDSASQLMSDVRWHAITVDLGVRRTLPVGLDLAAALGVELPLVATQRVDGAELDTGPALEAWVAVVQAGVGWTPRVAAPLRVEVMASLDLSARGAIGDAGGTVGRCMVSVDYLFAFGAE